jgi:hypothetical protein
MASLPRLLLFCDFLETRLHTQSLALLRRMLRDFFAGNEHTLLDFMRLGASVVAVMPIERKGPLRQKEAERLLAEQRSDSAVHPEASTDVSAPLTMTDSSSLCVFRYLTARVATKNMLWLRDMFNEFCRGEDTLVKEFVRRGDEPISVVPVDIQALCMAPLPPPPLGSPAAVPVAMETEAPQATLSEGAPSPQKKRSLEEGTAAVDAGTRKQRRSSSETPSTDEAEIEGAIVPVSLTAPQTPLSVDDVRVGIMQALERVGAKEPWKQGFKPETLELPFSRVKYPKLAGALLEFWETHARAAWERKFWAPLSRSRTHELHNQRRCRQSKAQNFFEKNVIVPVHKEFGAAFFLALDQRKTPLSGWYYIGQAVDLFTLAQRFGLPACLAYIEQESTKRFPVAPGATRNFFCRVNGRSASMWSSSSALSPILDEIVAFKTKPKDVRRSVEL